MLYGKRFGLLQQDVEEESLNFIKAVKTVWKSLSWGRGDFLALLGQFERGSWKKQLRLLCYASQITTPVRAQLVPGFCLLSEMPQPDGENAMWPSGQSWKESCQLAWVTLLPSEAPVVQPCCLQGGTAAFVWDYTNTRGFGVSHSCRQNCRAFGALG